MKPQTLEERMSMIQPGVYQVFAEDEDGNMYVNTVEAFSEVQALTASMDWGYANNRLMADRAHLIQQRLFLFVVNR